MPSPFSGVPFKAGPLGRHEGHVWNQTEEHLLRSVSDSVK